MAPIPLSTNGRLVHKKTAFVTGITQRSKYELILKSSSYNNVTLVNWPNLPIFWRVVSTSREEGQYHVIHWTCFAYVFSFLPIIIRLSETQMISSLIRIVFRPVLSKIPANMNFATCVPNRYFWVVTAKLKKISYWKFWTSEKVKFDIQTNFDFILRMKTEYMINYY